MNLKLNRNENILSELEMERHSILKDFKNKKILSHTALEKLRYVNGKIKAARRGRL